MFYAAESVQTAATEVAFYRALFFILSPETNAPDASFEMTAFCTRIRTEVAVHITKLGAEARKVYADPVDYAACHKLAEAARKAGAEVIRFPSVRDYAGVNVAGLDCAAFADATPRDMQGWWFPFTEHGLFGTQRFGKGHLEFSYEMFANDPRISGGSLG